MRSWIAHLALLSACGFSAPAPSGDGGGPDGPGGGDGPDGSDGSDDGSVPPDAQQCFGPFLNVCLSALPTMPIVVSAVDSDLDINTDTGAVASQCDPGISTSCVVAATAITVAATKKIRARGARPLVLVALANLELFGEIDVSSSTDGTVRGAGASMVVCANANPPVPATGASGGFGGSFGGRGGDGEAVSGNRGEAAPAVAFPSNLQGGCPGGAGASGSAGGLGGGAVGIYAATITLDGRINASGAGGRGGPQLRGGGGGGGSGGMIVLDVPQSAITLGSNGRLFANGGGGAEGGTGTGTGVGDDGNASTGPNVPGTGGGDLSTPGGDGGPGSSGAARAGGNAVGQSQDNGGGGAGGGGAGFIHAVGVTGSNIIAPPSTDIVP
jgi:hypothetical protein